MSNLIHIKYDTSCAAFFLFRNPKQEEEEA